MKRIINNFFFSLLSFCIIGTLAVAPAYAEAGDVTIWNMQGSYTIDFTCTAGCSGTYTHTMNVTSEDFNTGNFNGNGHYNADPSYTWNVNGNVNGSSNALTFHLLYTGTLAGYTLDATGTVKFDGTLSGTATDSLGETFTWQSTSGKATPRRIQKNKELSKKQCNPVGRPVVDVAETILNDADSGFGSSTAWAFDTIGRRIRIWNTADSKFCAEIKDNGHFEAVSGHLGPAGTGTIGNNVHGNIDGGYRTAPFAGTLKATPGPNFHTFFGNVGTFDYQCDASFNCPGYVSWTEEYFSDVTLSSLDLNWWGWTYKANAKHGTWINASTGNSGNIQ